MTARALALVVGAFYLIAGAWALLFSESFYSSVATFAPYNVHLLHDAGAFQGGLGVALVAAVVARRGLVPALVGVLAGSVLHLAAHVVDVRLGGHPGTDLTVLALVVVVLALALALELRRAGPETAR